MSQNMGRIIEHATRYEIEKMKRLRLIKGLSLTEVAESLKVSKQYLCSIENNARTISRDNYYKILKTIQSFKSKDFTEIEDQLIEIIEQSANDKQTNDPTPNKVQTKRPYKKRR